MELPEAFTDDSNLGLAYEKKLYVNEQLFYSDDKTEQLYLIQKLLDCLAESNKLNKHDCPFYQLRVRPGIYIEEPKDMIVFELRWGSKGLLNEEKEEVRLNIDKQCKRT